MGGQLGELILRIRTKNKIVSFFIACIIAGGFSLIPLAVSTRAEEPSGQTAGPQEATGQGPEAPAPDQKPLRIPLTEVIGTAPEALEHIPGSGRVVTQESLWKNHRLTINEALREVPG